MVCWQHPTHVTASHVSTTVSVSSRVTLHSHALAPRITLATCARHVCNHLLNTLIFSEQVIWDIRLLQKYPFYIYNLGMCRMQLMLYVHICVVVHIYIAVHICVVVCIVVLHICVVVCVAVHICVVVCVVVQWSIRAVPALVSTELRVPKRVQRPSHAHALLATQDLPAAAVSELITLLTYSVLVVQRGIYFFVF